MDMTPEALVALANPGVVRRAQRDLASGLGPEVTLDDDSTVVASFPDGIVTRLREHSALRDADCSCNAMGWCRHRIMLVLACQRADADKPLDADDDGSGPWTPARFADDLNRLPVSAQREARRRLAGGIMITLDAPDGVPTAHLPMNTVRFLSSTGVQHALCDCQSGGSCAHVMLAVWAFDKAKSTAHSAMAAEVLVRLGDGVDEGPLLSRIRDVRDEIERAMVGIWRTGAARENAVITQQMSRVCQTVRDLGWIWVETDLALITGQLRDLQERSAMADAHTLLRLMGETIARLDAALARSSDQAPEHILGVGVAGETTLAHLRLVSLGSECWLHGEKRYHRLYMLDPDTGHVGIIDRMENWSPGQVGSSLRVAGHSLASMAQGHLIARGVRRRALGLLDLRSDRRLTSVSPLDHKVWQASRHQTRGLTLGVRPSFTRPRTLGSHLALLDVGSIRIWGYDSASQTITAWVDGDVPFRMELRHTPAAPGALDSLAGALSSEGDSIRIVSGEVRRSNGIWSCRPLAIGLEHSVINLATQPVASRPMPSLRVHEPAGVHARLLAEVLALLIEWLRRGMNQVDESALQRAEQLAEQLGAAGLTRSGTRLQQACTALRTDLARGIVQLLRVSLLIGMMAERV